MFSSVPTEKGPDLDTKLTTVLPAKNRTHTHEHTNTHAHTQTQDTYFLAVLFESEDTGHAYQDHRKPYIMSQGDF